MHQFVHQTPQFARAASTGLVLGAARLTGTSRCPSRLALDGYEPLPERAGEWNLLRDCRAERCGHSNLSLSGVAVENCELDGLSRKGPSLLILWACVFKQVRLRDRLTGMKLNPEYDLLDCNPAIQAQWVAAMLDYYKDVEWALDIREAEFTSAPILEAVPGHLVRRDPERQVLVRREALVGRNLRVLPHWVALEWFIERSPFDSVVLVGSCVRARQQKDLDGLHYLRDLGIADPG